VYNVRGPGGPGVLLAPCDAEPGGEVPRRRHRECTYIVLRYIYRQSGEACEASHACGEDDHGSSNAALCGLWGRAGHPSRGSGAITGPAGECLHVPGWRAGVGSLRSGRRAWRASPEGKAWSPGETPALLFTSTPLDAGGTRIPAGAYSLFFIPNKNEWALVVNKDVRDAKYDEQQNLARLTMDLGMVEQPGKDVSLAFGHIGPKQCNLRLYYGKTGAWATFREP